MAEDKTILLMANHGVLAVGETIAAAFDELYYFERAAETLMTCYATGKELRIVSDAVARMTEKQWRGYGQLAVDHLENIKAILDVEERRIGVNSMTCGSPWRSPWFSHGAMARAAGAGGYA